MLYNVLDGGSSGDSKDTWINTNTSITAEINQIICADTSSGSFTIYLPSSPIGGNIVGFEDYSGSWDTNNLTIDGNGNTILGNNNLIADKKNSTFGLRFNGNEWVIGFA